MAKFDNQNWDKVPFYRKRIWVFVWMFLFWPISLLSVLTGRVYRKTSEGAKALWMGTNVAVVVWPAIVGIVFALLMPNQASVKSLSCENQEKTAIKAIDGSTLLHTLHVRVITNSQPVRLSKDGKGIYCQTVATLSNTKTVTLKYHAFIDPNHDNRYLVVAKIEK